MTVTPDDDAIRFDSLEDMLAASLQAIRPPERLTVSEAASKYHFVNLPGTHVGFFSMERTPYLREPQDTLQSLQFTGVVFAGPARAGKSVMHLNWLTTTAICDPADMMFVQMTQSTARNWSKSDFDRLVRESPEVRKRMTPGRMNDNTHDKTFLSGMRVEIKWPAISELSSKTIPRLGLLDYDRMPEDIDGEGNPFDLTRKRAETFQEFGMCMAESSPGYEISDPKWAPSTPHEAPPTKGILALYNRGDRRRWYWQCPSCSEAFEPDFKHLSWPTVEEYPDKMDRAERVEMICPHNGCAIKHEQKRALNIGGRWLRDGETWNADGTITGTPRRSDIASFWLKGPAAGFATWKTLVLKWLTANEEYNRTGSEESLKTTVNTDQGEPYKPKALDAARLPEALKDRIEDWGGSAEAPVVPDGVRFLIKTVDVQARAFVVQTHGVTAAGDFPIIETKKLRNSATLNDRGERLPIDPAARPEDWDVLIEELEQTYPLADDSGRRMAIKIMGCDSGGKAGVTPRAYSFWRRLRDRGDGSHARFHLIKGEGKPDQPRIQTKFPDSNRKDRNAGARGDVPVEFVNTNMLKDQVSAMLGRDIEAPDGIHFGRVRFPAWAEDWLFAQLTAEIRMPNGAWMNPSQKRNEAWDLLVYAVALSMHPSIKIEFVDWTKPPGWAADWDANSLVSAPGQDRRFSTPRSGRSLSDIAGDLG